MPPNNTVISPGNANATAKTTNMIVAILICSPSVSLYISDGTIGARFGENLRVEK